MKQDFANIWANGYKAGLERAWRIFRKVDRNQPAMKMPLELTARMKKAVGEVEDYLYEHGGRK